MGTHIGQIGEMTKEYRELTYGMLGNKFNFIFLLLAIVIVFLLKNTYEKSKKLKFNEKESLIISLYIVLVFFFLGNKSTFLYFNF